MAAANENKFSLKIWRRVSEWGPEYQHYSADTIAEILIADLGKLSRMKHLSPPVGGYVLGDQDANDTSTIEIYNKRYAKRTSGFRDRTYVAHQAERNFQDKA